MSGFLKKNWKISYKAIFKIIKIKLIIFIILNICSNIGIKKVK